MLGAAAVFAHHLHESDHAVIQHGHVVEEVEALKHHANLRTIGGYIIAALHNILLVKQDLTGGRNFQQVDTAEQRGLPGAGSADDARHIAFFYREVDIPQHDVFAKGFGEVLNL
ncbi:hypothetical protein SDC9_145850 [bioreactor metagenome]|uniref:Uncharacterized protein n=1 Tax=bioreactor metagenome TaxID=1076179 RepID=A0A645EDC4_9ZZZZ